MDKKEIRKHVLQLRGNIAEEERKAKSNIIVDSMIRSPLYQQAACVFTFIPFGDEVDIRIIIEDGISKGKRMAIPKTFSKEKYMQPYEFKGWDRLVSGVYGILEPDPEKERQIEAEEIDLIIVPGVAFDSLGGRLGYGGGFYDRYLSTFAKLPLLMAVCFQEQLLEKVPMHQHDFRVNYIVTDEVFIHCQR